MLILQTIIGTASSLTVVLIAWFIAYGVGSAFDSGRPQPLVEVAPWLAAAFVARGLLSWLSDLAAVRASIAVKAQLRRDVMQAYLVPSAGQPDHGTVTTLISSGLDDLDGYFAKYLPQLVLAVTVPLVIGIAIAVQDLLSAVIIAGTLPLIPIFMILIGWTTQKLTGRRWRVQARLAHHFADLIAGLPTLRAFGRAKAQAEGLRRSGEANRVETLATLRIALLSALVLELLATLSVAIVAVVIGLRVISGSVDLTTSLFVLILAPEAYLPLRKVGSHYHDAANGAAAARAALDLIDAAPEPSVGEDELPAGPLTVTVAGVGFAYPGAAPVLDSVDLIAPARRLTCLTGPSGGGKSTLLSMIMGWTRPDAGRLMINDRDLARIRPDALRNAIAWVGQNPALVTGTVADNVRMGRPSASLVQVKRAMAAAGVDLDPDRRLQPPDGMLSAGELRRLALARAWLRVRYGGARLMILDEPTAGLDEQTELDALATIRRLGVTALVVSHRPAVLASADEVIQLTGPGTGSEPGQGSTSGQGSATGDGSGALLASGTERRRA
ncbi:thiol reductant ABC exporter subunit CydD [Microlunatus elymi]|uniref:thiol reductant ABC exporter subunit CydD n=1 Tax=Microlunatus elymi TaxID=2596828 RepID=UPI001D187908|nr:thiol reductant ABC exporter subunit CydD [Microlunatus elymi]